MRRTLVIFCLLAAVVAPRTSAQSSPRLVVILVVDQMRADYLRTFERHWQGGFRMLLREGAVFENARYPYMSTFTCAGHSTIGTGTFPRTHGMVSNAWWQRDAGAAPECTVDDKAPAVSYGRAVQGGNSPKYLLVNTLADELRGQKPGARVVAVSLKSRSAITLAGHAGDAVVWFDDPAGTFTTSQAYTKVPVPAVKQFIDANPYEKDFGRIWNLFGPADSYIYRDAGIGERPPTNWTGLFPHGLVIPARGGTGRAAATPAANAARPASSAAPAGATAPAPAASTSAADTGASDTQETATAQTGATTTAAGRGRAGTAALAAGTATAAPATNPLAALWQSTPFADAYLARMATALVGSFGLGQRNSTDFLSIGFSTLDDVGHAFGPQSREVEDILRHLDATIGGLIETLDARVGRGNYVLGFSADHGVLPFVGFGRGGRVHNEDIRDRVEETLVTLLGPLPKGTYVEAMSTGQVYFSPGVFDRLKAHPTAIGLVNRAIGELPGVTRVLRADQLSDRSSDQAVRAAALSYVPGRSGDLIVVAQENWTITGRAVFSASHGAMYDYDTHVPLILFGGAIKPGRVAAAASPADIAPTLAQITGVKLPRAEGRVLKEALR